MKRVIVFCSILLLLAPFTALAQIDYCEGNFDCDLDVDGSDASVFKSDFGRSGLSDPCPDSDPCYLCSEIISLPKTGQTTSYFTGDDGDLEKGVAWPNPRFTDNGNGTVTDNLTGLMWLKEANCIDVNYPGFDNDCVAGDGRVRWQHALDFVAGINDGTYPNCGAGATDWRLPNINELESLVHRGYINPAVPNTAGTGQWSQGDPFNNVQSNFYWSSTTDANGGYAWIVYMGDGSVSNNSKVSIFYVWPVRGGN